MAKRKLLILAGLMMLFISGPVWATDQPGVLHDSPAILATLDKTGVSILNDVEAAVIRGQGDPQYVLVKIWGINMFDGGRGVVWTWNPLGYRYGYWGGPGWTDGYGDGTTYADTMDGCFMAHDKAYNTASGNPELLLADAELFNGLKSLPKTSYPYWGSIYVANPTGLTSPDVSVAGFSLIGGKFFFGWRKMPYTEYSRREAMAAVGAMVFGRSLISAIRLQ
ncbi:MAG: hypothetical protein JXA41_04460 [Deltaproteobacteria bacterium]|nr:hypothetical protein [Deltaproteobacteria bacterium]